MSTQDFLAKSAFDDLANSIEQALSDTEGFRDEAENFADLARRGIRLVPPGVVDDLNSFPANPEGGDAVFVKSETQIYFFDSDTSEWEDSKIIGSAIWGNVQGTLSDQSDLQTALDGKAELGAENIFTENQNVNAMSSIGGRSHQQAFTGAQLDLNSSYLLTLRLTGGSDNSYMTGEVQFIAGSRNSGSFGNHSHHSFQYATGAAGGLFPSNHSTILSTNGLDSITFERVDDNTVDVKMEYSTPSANINSWMVYASCHYPQANNLSIELTVTKL